MDQNQNTSLFGLNIDQIAKTYLYETARWARFLAICGFIIVGLMVIFSIFMLMNFSNIESQMEEMPGAGSGLMSGMGTIAFIFYIIIAIICFFPFLFLIRFANKMKAALVSSDQTELNESFRNLKVYYQYIGILTIIGLAFMALSVISMIATFSMM
jgi:uncharacterized membrane protein YjgN (DUF898 family)